MKLVKKDKNLPYGLRIKSRIYKHIMPGEMLNEQVMQLDMRLHKKIFYQ